MHKNYRVSYVANYYDGADRLTQSVDEGVKVGGYTRPASPDPRSATALRTDYEYDAAGGLLRVTDPLDVKTLTQRDALGRVVKQTDAEATPPNPMTKVTDYLNLDGLDRPASVVVHNVRPDGSPQPQTTSYLYAARRSKGSGVDSNDVLGTQFYPDNHTEVSRYNALGEVVQKDDRSHDTHVYTRDAFGRVTTDNVTVFGAGIDTAVNKLYTAYDTLGRPVVFTSYHDQTPLNEVVRAYNGFNQLTQEWQEDGGAVNTARSHYEAYDYGTFSPASNSSRLRALVFKGGARKIYYGYDAFGRVTSVTDGDPSGPAGTHQGLENYTYLGLDTVLQKIRPQPGDMKETVTLDGFGRVSDVLWAGDHGVDHFAYGYDADSNVLWRDNAEARGGGQPLWGEQYVRDSAGRQVSYLRGDLSGGQVASPPAASLTWSLDSQGNRYDLANVTPARFGTAYNGGNQPAATTPSGPDDTGFPNSAPIGGGAQPQSAGLKYDAWGRLVGAGTDQVALFTYDALGRVVLSRTYPFRVSLQDCAGQ